MKLIYNQSNLISIFPKTISGLFLLLLLTQPAIANSNNFYSGDVGRFTARVKNCEVKVFWNTETEDNIKLFQLEWSGDGKTFHAIHTELSSGSSPSNAEYVFLDENASYYNFYRLKTIYLDGSSKHTKAVLAQKKCKINNTLTVFPNPVSANANILNLEFIPTKSQAQILINDMLGRTIQRINYDVEPRIENKFELDISNYPAGTYNMIVVGEQQAKIFVIK
jgi:hypothetical protein